MSEGCFKDEGGGDATSHESGDSYIVCVLGDCFGCRITAHIRPMCCAGSIPLPKYLPVGIGMTGTKAHRSIPVPQGKEGAISVVDQIGGQSGMISVPLLWGRVLRAPDARAASAAPLLRPQPIHGAHHARGIAARRERVRKSRFCAPTGTVTGGDQTGLEAL